MKISVNRKALSQAWKTAAAAVPSRTPKDILKSVKCRAVGGIITLTATDSEVTIWSKVAGTISEEGECLLPADRFSAVLQAANAEEVTISTSETGVAIQCGRSKVALQTAKVEEFPVPVIDMTPISTVPADLFQKAVSFAMTAISPGDTRYALTGIYFGSKDGRLVIAATDSKKVTVHRLGECPAFEGVVIPEKAAACLKAAGFKGDIQFSTAGNMVSFASEDVTVSSRVVEGKWPEMALDFINGGRVFATCRIAAGIWCGMWNQVKATLDPESMGADCDFGESITLKHQGPAGNSEASSPCEFSGTPQSMQFAVDLVLPPSKVFEATDILEVESANPYDADADEPCVFRAKSGDRTFLLMMIGK